MSQKRVILFTAPGCGHCQSAKVHLKQHNITFKQIDISKDPDAAADCARHGCRGVPVVLVGAQWICGFDKTKINQALGLKG